MTIPSLVELCCKNLSMNILKQADFKVEEMAIYLSSLLKDEKI
jgi:hypothetical protein